MLSQSKDSEPPVVPWNLSISSAPLVASVRAGWLCDHMLTAMETPAARVWRFTPADGNPAAHAKQSGTNVTIALAQGPYPLLTFAQATLVDRIVNGSTPPVSKAGLWVVQQLAAPMPEGWRCQIS